jgi:hypothetical protein
MSGGAVMNPQATKHDRSNRSLEERLALVEAMLVDLQRQVETNSAPKSWLEQITGAFQDDPVFEEMLRYGREYRESDYPDYCQPEHS